MKLPLGLYLDHGEPKGNSHGPHQRRELASNEEKASSENAASLPGDLGFQLATFRSSTITEICSDIVWPKTPDHLEIH